MSDEKTYVERVRANTRAYIEEILADNASLRASTEQLRAELARRDSEHRRHEERFVEIEQENANLAALYAASYQLHSSLSSAEVISTIQEIIINLVGSEELAILRVGPATLLEPLALTGVTPEKVATLSPDLGLVRQALAGGEPVAAPNDEGMTACIPLLVSGQPYAMVVIFRLLPQKPALGPIDMELFGLLGRQAARALYCAELHERHGR